MPNVKISSLPAVTTLSNSDVLPAVASTGTSKITLKDLANTLPEVTSSISSSFATTASFVRTSVTSSYPIAVSGSTLYSTSPKAGVPTSNTLTNSIILGNNAGLNSTNSPYSNFLGGNAGNNATNAGSCNFLGFSAGAGATSAGTSNFIGSYAGQNATNSNNSNFIGYYAGKDATSADTSNFIGYLAGNEAINARFSTLIGYKAGYGAESVGSIGQNNIIIGNNISLENGRTDSINIGGLIFGTGSYFEAILGPSSGSANGKIGINQPLPLYSLDVSGSFRVQDGFTILTKVSESLNFVNDTAAASGGVPLGGLYRSGSLIVIRLV